MDIVCPNCKTLGKIDDNCVGEEINCPQCEHDFICSDQLFNFTPTNKPTATETVEPIIAKPATKKCPYCAESIKIEASRCKHCNKNFTKSRTTFILLALFLGNWGAHQFYIGNKHSGTGFIVLNLLVNTAFIAYIIGKVKNSNGDSFELLLFSASIVAFATIGRIISDILHTKKDTQGNLLI